MATVKVQRTWIEWVVIAIAIITIVSGLAQMLAPGIALSAMGIGDTPETRLLFTIVSLFTALFGAALLHAMLVSGNRAVIALWAGLQKVCGSSAVLIGVLQSLVAPTALLVAGYDFLAGLFVLWYWLRIRSASLG